MTTTKIEAQNAHMGNLDDEKQKSIGPGVDDALAFAIGDGNEVVWTDDEERRILRKIDFLLVPLIFLANLIGYGDTQIYGFAAIFGLMTDLGLVKVSLVDGEVKMDNSRYQWTTAIVALGTIASLYPLLYLAQFLPSGKVFGTVVMYVGLVALLTIVCTNFAQVMALRWKTHEQPLRMGIGIAGTAFGSLFGQGVDFGAIELKGVYAKSPWKWIYVILGSITMFIGLVIFAIFPATPMKAWFLSHREKQIAVLRLITNKTGIHTRKFKWKQVREAFLDPQLYCLVIFSFTFAFANNATSSFGSLLLQSFGYTPRRCLVLAMPVSAVAAFTLLLSGFLGRMFPQRRILIAILFILPTIVGNSLLWKAPRDNKPALLAGLYISATFYGALVQHYSLIAANVAGHSKKTVITATITIMANLGSFCGPWAYKGEQAATGYRDGQIATVTLMAASIVAYGLLWIHYTRSNKRKTALSELRVDHDPTMAFMDMTDRENAAFQYTR
ncbi:hypothetical protein FQN50_005182 [Emmonsiellopsis sp. PD_5]|nr:hypothetical protein FQN50_005182 [Emmonsiellopsis sp. PD_5]